MRTAIVTLLAALGLGVAGGFVFVWFGVYDVSATTPHWPSSYWVMETVRERSIKVRAAGIGPPSGMTGEATIVAGTEHFAAHCAICHGAPGVPRGDIASGLYPRPADLKDTAKRYTSGELFWIVKNGIKMSGMPAWNDHGDDELWSIVAFIEKLPGMSEDDYRKLVMESMLRGGGQHDHGGMNDAKPGGMRMDHPAMPGMAPEPSDARDPDKDH